MDMWVVIKKPRSKFLSLVVTPFKVTLTPSITPTGSHLVQMLKLLSRSGAVPVTVSTSSVARRLVVSAGIFSATAELTVSGPTASQQVGPSSSTKYHFILSKVGLCRINSCKILITNFTWLISIPGEAIFRSGLTRGVKHTDLSAPVGRSIARLCGISRPT